MLTSASYEAIASSYLSYQLGKLNSSYSITESEKNNIKADIKKLAELIVEQIKLDAVVVSTIGAVTGLDSLAAPITLGTLTAGSIT